MRESSNPRLQRTPLRAPLSRKPLGASITRTGRTKMSEAIQSQTCYYRWVLRLFGGYLIGGVILVVILLASITDANAGYPALFFGSVLLVIAVPVCVLGAVLAGISVSIGPLNRYPNCIRNLAPVFRIPGGEYTGYPHGRKGYVVDHIVPLTCGGADAPANMQWQTKEEGKAKDKTERIGCK